MTTFVPKIAESYFQELLNNTPPIEAVTALSMFWGHRADSEKEFFGLSRPEYYSVLCTIYTGEVSNGGHAQFFANRGTILVSDIETALKAIGCVQHAAVLVKSAETVLSGEPKTWIDLENVPEKTFDKWAASDQDLWALPEVDGPLVQYLRVHSNDILKLERGLPNSKPPS